MPLLWVIRDFVGLTGTKYGCGLGHCGACTVHLDGHAIRSCSVPIAAAAGKAITTIEGLSTDGQHPLQRAWEECDVPQCGYCQAGQLMTRRRVAARQPQADGRANHRGDVGQPVPMRHLPAHPPRHQEGQRVRRREFVRDSLLAAGGLTLCVSMWPTSRPWPSRPRAPFLEPACSAISCASPRRATCAS